MIHLGADARLCECGCGQATKSAPVNDPKRGWIKGQPLRFLVGHYRPKPRHGHSPASGGTREYHSWRCMLRRCRTPKNPQFSEYGGRGITVCERWSTFENFLADMGPRPAGHSLDRIDVNGNYEPGNVRWATAPEQNRNKRHTVSVTHDGLTLPVVDWAAKYGLSRHVLYRRLKYGWSMARAVSTPTAAYHMAEPRG